MNNYQNYLNDYNSSLNRNIRDLYQHDNYNKRIQEDISREKQLENKILNDSKHEHRVNELEFIEYVYGDTDSYYPHLAEFYRREYGENSKLFKDAWKKVLQIFSN